MRVRRAIYVAAIIGFVAAAPDLARAVLASGASVLLESTPYLIAASLLVKLAGPRIRSLLPYVGCGCEEGPGARSIPAAVATAILFGPAAAIGRFGAATAVAAMRPGHADHRHATTLLGDLYALAPSAGFAALLMNVAPNAHIAAQPAMIQLALGLTLGFFASPCALGSVAIASALRAQSPLAAGAYLCVAGIADLRVWRTVPMRRVSGDAIGYALLGAAAIAVAARSGAALVHPHVALALAFSTPALMAYAYLARGERAAQSRWVPAAILVALVFGAPAPAYHATETTLADAFAGEHLDFTGALVCSHARCALVRYAITCCRADAQPVAVSLAYAHGFASGTWLHATGKLAERNGALFLLPERISVVGPPSDPFVYR